MPEIGPSKYLVQAGWDDVPHLDAQTKREYLQTVQPHLVEARTKGVPSLGSGAVYPIPTDQITVAPFAIPQHWPRGFALDVGWKCTAALWGAHDRDADVIYLYTEHYRGHAEPSVHAAAIKARGEWIPGVIDPASSGSNQADGRQLMEAYRSLGLNLEPAMNAVEAGIHNVFERLSTGRLKVFSTMQNWLAEYRLYRRDEKGKIVKEFDHLMDDTRYLVSPVVNAPGDRTSGLARMAVEPPKHRGLIPSAAGGDRVAGY